EHFAACACETGYRREQPKRESIDQPAGKPAHRALSQEASQASNTQAISQLPLDLEEQQEFVPAAGGRNLASGGQEVNGS
ncbi:hypothetical protein EDB80DRAFT_595673, partial [Ilyonectria destructans]